MNLLHAIHRKTSLEFDAAIAQKLIYGLALLVMVVGIREVTVMRLTEEHLAFGMVLVLILALQMVIMATLVGFHARKP